MENIINLALPREKRFEGWRKWLYVCSSGDWTIGHGHNCTANGIPDEFIAQWGTKPIFNQITKAQGEWLLIHDIKQAFTDAVKIFGFNEFSNYPENVHSVIIDMLFTMGRNRFMTFKNMIIAIQDQNWIVAAKEIKDSLWYQQITDIVEKLKAKGRTDTFHRADDDKLLMMGAL